MIRLYTWGTPNGNKLHIVLEELKVPYELVPVSLVKREQHSADYLRINPNAKIPAIVDSDGPDGAPLALFESGAILIYLAEKSGRLLPNDARGRIIVIQWIMFQMANIGPMIGQLHHFTASAPEQVRYAISRYRTECERLLAVMDGRLAEANYLAGAEYTIADISTWPWIRSWVHTLKNTLGDWPHVKRWYEAIEQRPAVGQALQIYDRLRASAA